MVQGIQLWRSWCGHRQQLRFVPCQSPSPGNSHGTKINFKKLLALPNLSLKTFPFFHCFMCAAAQCTNPLGHSDAKIGLGKSRTTSGKKLLGTLYTDLHSCLSEILNLPRDDCCHLGFGRKRPNHSFTMIPHGFAAIWLRLAMGSPSLPPAELRAIPCAHPTPTPVSFNILLTLRCYFHTLQNLFFLISVHSALKIHTYIFKCFKFLI